MKTYEELAASVAGGDTGCAPLARTIPAPVAADPDLVAQIEELSTNAAQLDPMQDYVQDVNSFPALVDAVEDVSEAGVRVDTSLEDIDNAPYIGRRFHYIKVVETICIESNLTGKQLVDEIAESGQLPSYNPMSECGIKNHYVHAVNGMSTFPVLTQSQLLDQLPWGSEFSVAVFNGDIVQCPMGAVPLTRNLWDEYEFDDNPSLFKFLPEGSEEAINADAFFITIGAEMLKDDVIEILQALRLATLECMTLELQNTLREITNAASSTFEQGAG